MVSPPLGGAASLDEDAAYQLIRMLDLLDLSRFSVAGNYARYDEHARNALKDAGRKIVSGLERPSRKRENHLIWAAPGTGKTYLVQQLARSLTGSAHYEEINLAKAEEHDFRTRLEGLNAVASPVLCLIDEIDAKPDASWPYEILLPFLDAASDQGKPWVFVLAGSSGGSRSE